MPCLVRINLFNSEERIARSSEGSNKYWSWYQLAQKTIGLQPNPPGTRSIYPSAMMPLKIHALGGGGGGMSVRNPARLDKDHHGYSPRIGHR